ncbi:MAG: M48 family metallopeptidase [Elusimicrobia bacterium]|nr:M48 family metallopeptidase [Elusimicrobiota bacterium]
MNLYEQQISNKRRSWIIVGFFIVFLGVLGLGFDVFILGMNPVSEPIGLPYGTMAAVGGGVLMSAMSFWSGPSMVVKASRARLADSHVAEENQLIHVVQEMSTASGLPMPKVYVIPDPDLNAFATGTNPENSVVAVTEGLLKQLNREELQGVVGHEMSHIRNYDVRLMTLLAALTGAIALLSDWTGRSFRFSGRGRNREGRGGGGGAVVLVVFGVWLILMILAPLLSQILALAVSRRREYLADASGTELTRNPAALASALEKIEKAVGPTASVNQGLAHLCIADPKGSLMGEKEGFWADLLSTHPPLSKRILALKVMAYQNQGLGAS